MQPAHLRRPIAGRGRRAPLAEEILCPGPVSRRDRRRFASGGCGKLFVAQVGKRCRAWSWFRCRLRCSEASSAKELCTGNRMPAGRPGARHAADLPGACSGLPGAGLVRLAAVGARRTAAGPHDYVAEHRRGQRRFSSRSYARWARSWRPVEPRSTQAQSRWRRAYASLDRLLDGCRQMQVPWHSIDRAGRVSSESSVVRHAAQGNCALGESIRRRAARSGGWLDFRASPVAADRPVAASAVVSTVDLRRHAAQLNDAGNAATAAAIAGKREPLGGQLAAVRK